jgi:hypothetical protein
LNAVRRNTRHIFNAWGHSNGYIEDVEAAIAKYKTGGYNFDSRTPQEHSYTDIGWYGLVTIGEGTPGNNAGSVVFPVKINGNNGLSTATFTVTGEFPLADVITANGEKLTYKSNYDDSEGLYTYTITFRDPDPKIADYLFFSLVYDGDNAGKVSKEKINMSCADALDRIGHPTTLYVGERPVSSPNDRQRGPGMGPGGPGMGPGGPGMNRGGSPPF